MPHILLFDLYTGGHHLSYLQHLAGYWVRNGCAGTLEIAVPEAFVERHPGLAEMAATHAGSGLRLTPLVIPTPLREGEAGLRDLIQNDRLHGHVLRRIVEQSRPDHAVLMYFDHVQLSLGFGLRFAFPVELSGIYFRPSFHYSHLGQEAPGWKARLQQARKRVVLARALRNPHLRHLFCLDPFVVPFIEQMRSAVRPVFLPDGFSPRPATDDGEVLRRQWGAAPEQTVALFFGMVDSRKGIFQVLDALPRLSAEAQARLCLVVAGPMPPEERPAIEQALATARTRSAVRLVTDTRFIPDAEVQPHFAAADLALVTYQRHIGSSNVLIRAAAEGIPVIGANDGLVGAHIRQKGLGLAVDATAPEAIARALEAALAPAAPLPFNADAARRFAAENTAERFAATLFERVGTGASGR